MLILDTDHFSEFIRGSEAGRNLVVKLDATTEDVALAIITAEEANRGWLAKIGKARDGRARLAAYERYHVLLTVLRNWEVIPWNAETDAKFEDLAGQKLRVGTMDLRIAAIALTTDATLLTRNLRDFKRVPGLRVENWLNA